MKIFIGIVIAVLSAALVGLIIAWLVYRSKIKAQMEYLGSKVKLLELDKEMADLRNKQIKNQETVDKNDDEIKCLEDAVKDAEKKREALVAKIEEMSVDDVIKAFKERGY